MTWTDGPVTVHLSDALAVLRELPPESVHCVVTSPPYWGLRDYGVPGQLGLEPTPEEYVSRMLEVFGEVRRVLRPDGTLWLNLGDSYAGSWGAQSRGNETGEDKVRLEDRSPLNARRILDGAYLTGEPGTGSVKRTPGLKPKDLIGVPWRLALALQADGWWLRSDIIWSKPNPMPESVTDRPTTAHEHVFLLARSARYFYDAEAVREAGVWPGQTRNVVEPITSHMPGAPAHVGLRTVGVTGPGRRRSKMPDGWDTGPGGHGSFHRNGREAGAPSEIRAGRNLRSVWTIATQPYPEAHFATFPEELARRCIAAGTSERGCCSECGTPWRRVVDVRYENPGDRTTNGPRSLERRDETAGFPVRLERRASTTGWQPTCTHDYEPVPCTVLDPFAGSGTTLAVARRMGRRAVGIELQADYLPLIRRRVEEAALPLLDEPPDPEPVAQQVDLEELLKR